MNRDDDTERPGLRVLLTGTEGWAIEHAATRLRAEGLAVLRCHDDEAGTFPCRGLRGEPCPADGLAEVVMTVRAHPLPQPVRAEVAVTCGLHHGLPLVVAGATVLNPFADFTTVECRELNDVVQACRDAVLETDLRDRTTRAALGEVTGATCPL